MRILSRLAGWIPVRWLPWLGAALGWWLLNVLRVRRRVTLDNLQRGLGISEHQALQLARRVYRHLCQGALEFLRIHRLTTTDATRILSEPGLERLRSHLAGGRGLLVLTAHLGQWDLLACAAARAGLAVNVVTRQIKTNWINRFWMQQRATCGVKLLPARGGGRAIVEALRRNEMVALVLDQHEPDGAAVPFFGRMARTGTALARLARMTSSPVVPVFLVRSGAGFRLVVEEPVDLGSSGDASASAVHAATAQMTRILEQQIRSHPDQWLWLHRRWKLDDPTRCGAAR